MIPTLSSRYCSMITHILENLDGIIVAIEVSLKLCIVDSSNHAQQGVDENFF